MSARRVAAFVALHDRPIQRLHVAGTLWMESTEEHANANLRTALWRLRKRRASIVGATSSHLTLSRSVTVDVREATACAQRILRGDHGEAGDLATLAPAVELLPDWYDDWVVIERERLRQLCVHALERLSVEARSEGRFARAAEAGLAAVAFEPLRESAHRVVIEAHLAEGNAAEAVRHYGVFEQLLRSRLGLEPSPLMRELVGSLLTVTTR
jgi:DNA-binding SARP family transcriptional activator